MLDLTFEGLKQINVSTDLLSVNDELDLTFEGLKREHVVVTRIASPLLDLTFEGLKPPFSLVLLVSPDRWTLPLRD